MLAAIIHPLDFLILCNHIIAGNVIARADDSTIRHVNCSMLVKPGVRCEQCKLYRNNSLLRQLNRLKMVKEDKENDKSAASSHVNYRFLTPIQKDECLKNLHVELRKKPVSYIHWRNPSISCMRKKL